MLLLVASYIAYTIELAKGYRVVMNCGPDVGESVAHLHVHLLGKRVLGCLFFFSSRRRHTRCSREWSSDVCSSDLLSDTAEEYGGKNGFWITNDGTRGPRSNTVR